MTCGKCKGNFCWVCKQAIKDKNPYDHFKATNAASRWDNVKKSLNKISVFPCKFKTGSGGCRVFEDVADDPGLQSSLLKLFLFNLHELLMSIPWAAINTLQVVWFGWKEWL